MYKIIVLLCFNIAFAKKYYKIPEYFKLGAASSAYQIEGAWNEDGKGENIWDYLTHHDPGHIKGHANGDIACDSYHKYKDDVQMLKDLGSQFYRFSLSWSRILPSGFINKINWKGVQYYHNLIDELVRNNIEPMVTIYHWDLPQPLQEIGGWPNPVLEDHFAEYARLCFKLFGEKVKLWTTFNEPRLICHFGYGERVMAPAYKSSAIGDYLCGHTVLKAHAKAYHIYNNEFRAQQNGKVFIVLEQQWATPQKNTTEDEKVAELTRQFMFGWFAHPIYIGNYPQQMIDTVAARSKKQGFPKSRLPEFTKEEIEYIKGTSDFLGLNTYTTYLVTSKDNYTHEDVSWEHDIDVVFLQHPDWEKSASPLFRIVPWGIREILKWIKKNYNNPEVFITENGYADLGSLEDNGRIRFYKEHIQSVLEAKFLDGVNVTGYTCWTLMDNFEWDNGYTLKFGLYHVDFNSPNRTRTPKKSATYFRKLIDTRCLEDTC